MSLRNRVKESGPGRAMFLGVLFVCLLVTAGPALSQNRADAAKELSRAFSAAAKTAMPAVVSIKVEKAVEVNPMAGSGSPFGFNDPFGQFDDDFLRRFFGGRMPQRQSPQKYVERGQGSGFIISEDGYILTNNHVVGDVDKMTVELKDGRKFTDAKLIGTDPDSEVALIKIEGDHFPVLPLGDSDKIDVGDWVIAIGNPFGLNETVTVGVVSAVGRSNVHIAAYEDFIQTDAAINPGNSGGPLINLDGKVIGINTAIVSQSGGYMGIGFAIPVNMARTIADQLKSSGKVSRGYLGLYGQDVTPDVAELMGLKDAGGVVIAQVEEGGPADKAGLKSRDVILEMNGKSVQSYDTFRNEVAAMRPGSAVRLTGLRDGKPLDLTVTLGERPGATTQAQKPSDEPERHLGLQVQDLTKDLADQLGYEPGEGVVVTAVQPGGPAAEEGIQRGDLILSVNNRNVNSAREFGRAINAARKAGKVLLLVKRGDLSQFVVIPFE
ncbi:MAG: DegQ family serine endoprotease [Sedimentisphaerales bacterium]|nr:DegQ family serine endoprotease [Sedimentisphaerales bacterium]